MSFVPIIMGSGQDLPRGEKVAAALRELGVASEIRVASAHKTPEHLLGILEAYEQDPRPKVYLTIAGRSNALSGFVDARVAAPVVACPPLSADYAGADVWSSIRMPSGVAPALVLDPAGAALLCAKILGCAEGKVRARVAEQQERSRRGVIEADSALQPVG